MTRGGAPLGVDEAVLRPAPRLRGAQVAGSSLSLVVAGILLARGFVGLSPGRPVFVVLGLLLVATAIGGLAADHVDVHVKRESPEIALHRELNRSRRNGHHLSMIRISVRPALEARIVARLRTTDLAWRRHRALVVLLAETDRAGARRFLERIEDLVDTSSATIATFPDDALTADGLRMVLRGAGPRVRTLTAVPDGLEPQADAS